MPALDDWGSRRLILCLGLECQRLYTLVHSYRAFAEGLSPGTSEQIERAAKIVAAEPNVREHLGQIFSRYYDIATHGLDQATAQQLVDEVRELMDNIHEEEEKLGVN